MRIIISPAKKMYMDTDSLDWIALPQFLPEAERIRQSLQSMSIPQLQALWRCNDSITTLNANRLQRMDLRQNLTPAILSYEGIQYQYMAPSVFEEKQLGYIQEHLRILSGFYGILRPFDGVSPYRLEMQAKLAIDGYKNLYAYWGDKLAKQLSLETSLIVNLASKEYSKAVIPHLPQNVRLLTCSFCQWKEGKLVEKDVLCKMARGQMVRFLAEEKITDPERMKTFDQLNYTYQKDLSTPEHYIFAQK